MTSLPVNSRTYRDTIGRFASGVTIVAVELEGGEIQTLTANAVSSVSLEPILLAVCIYRHAKIMQALEKLESFSLNILNDEQAPLSNYFANIWPDNQPPPAYKFRSFAPYAPRLEGCIGSLACQLYNIVEGGDHWIVLGEVVDLYSDEDEQAKNPLLYYEGEYRQILPQELTTVPPKRD